VKSIPEMFMNVLTVYVDRKMLSLENRVYFLSFTRYKA
jgi:hypothetical protein